MVGGFCGDDLVFENFDPIGFLFYASSRSDVPPLSVEIIGLSLLHLVPEILGPKVGLIFHQNVLLKQFLSILYKFSPYFSIQLTLFLIVLRSF